MKFNFKEDCVTLNEQVILKGSLLETKLENFVFATLNARFFFFLKNDDYRLYSPTGKRCDLNIEKTHMPLDCIQFSETQSFDEMDWLNRTVTDMFEKKALFTTTNAFGRGQKMFLPGDTTFETFFSASLEPEGIGQLFFDFFQLAVEDTNCQVYSIQIYGRHPSYFLVNESTGKEIGRYRSFKLAVEEFAKL